MSSGTADKIKGRIEKAAGDLVDDPKLRRRGKVDEAAGKVKDAVERGIDHARDKANKP
jgi:uncharacterized protein YjbJ (UPF0337 family)